MKRITITILAIVFLAVQVQAAEQVTAIVEVEVDWSNGKFHNGTWTGARAVLASAKCFDSDESDCLKGIDKDGAKFGGFLGWLNLKEVEAGKLPTALVKIRTTTTKLVKMSARKKADNETYKYTIVSYRQADEKAASLVLDAGNLGVSIK